MKKIYIYQDEGASRYGVASLMKLAPKWLKMPAKIINANQLINENWTKNAGIFILPGGADLGYCKKLNGQGVKIIRDYLTNGGRFLGICAGAYFACSYVDFVGNDYEVKGERELALFKGKAKGSVAKLTKQLFSQTIDSKAIVELDYQNKTIFTYYHGGPEFIGNDNNCEIIAKYQKTQTPAVIKGKLGKGKFLLSAVHFETDKDIYKQNLNSTICDKEQKIINHFNDLYGKDLWLEVVKILSD